MFHFDLIYTTYSYCQSITYLSTNNVYKQILRKIVVSRGYKLKI